MKIIVEFTFQLRIESTETFLESIFVSSEPLAN